MFSAAASNDGNTIFGNTFVDIAAGLDISAASGWRGDYVNNFFQNVTAALVGTPTGGRYQTQNGGTITYAGAVQLANAANGVAGTLSGVLWSIVAQNDVVGLAVKASSAHSVALQQWLNNAGTVLAAIGPTGYLEMLEQTDPAAPGANRGRIYIKNNGSGKSQLVVKFASGAIVTIATDP
ncbi:MAG: hypothetical protein IRZ28_10335 [Steroidobacteraceae bacterium]|nr:hypothetical protein [Steroidobacteraceae bacterium]